VDARSCAFNGIFRQLHTAEKPEDEKIPLPAVGFFENTFDFATLSNFLRLLNFCALSYKIAT